MTEGYLLLALHAHLPYVLSHGTWPHGSDWLNEAACETYLPLLNLLGTFSRNGKRANYTIGITPVLCEMLASPLFRTGLVDYMKEKVGAAGEDGRYFVGRRERHMADLAARWRERYQNLLSDFTGTYEGDLIGAFRRFQEEGQVELIASAATHAYLPLLSLDASVSAQVKQGVETYRKHFLREPKGIWLPECGYRPGVRASSQAGGARRGIEEILREEGIDYFFVDGAHVADQAPADPYGACLGAVGRGKHGRGGAGDQYGYGTRDARGITSAGLPGTDSRTVHKTYYAGPGPCAFFTRDADVSLQVWSGQWGYPGDGDYLEFHKKHFPGGLRYWSITDRRLGLGEKKPYEPLRAAQKVLSHAAHFRRLVADRLNEHSAREGSPGVITAAFDAELFGHWWFEGIDWLRAVSGLFDGQDRVVLEKAGPLLAEVSPDGPVDLPEGSWGAGGGHHIWYNDETASMWDRIHEAERVMSRAAARLPGDDIERRIVSQMARENMLLQASDWEFLISTRGAKDYAEERFLDHYREFKALGEMLDLYRRDGRVPEAMATRLAEVEKRDALFDNVKVEWFRERTDNGL